ncbi:MAG: galactose-1-phosphate uridylyltransferase [Bacillota bacterium]
MPEWRKDPVVDRWVVIATDRAKRPTDYKCPVDEKLPQRCPLCPGRENETPPEILAFRRPGSEPNRPGWWVRVVPNKFPAVRIEERPVSWWDGMFQAASGLGAHEVIVEGPEHEDDLANLDEQQVEEVLWAWRARLLDLRGDTRLKYILIFKNKGRTAGASLFHAHSQLLATPMVPAEVGAEIAGVRRYHLQKGSCVYCDMLHQELGRGERVVLAGSRFVALSPFAARFPFETWILPRKHQHDFVLVDEEDIRELARILRQTLQKLQAAICDIPYNMVLHTAPVNTEPEVLYHWHLEILPRLTIMAGFEFGTGYYINPTPPEMAARALRNTEVPVEREPVAGVKEVGRGV